MFITPCPACKINCEASFSPTIEEGISIIFTCEKCGRFALALPLVTHFLQSDSPQLHKRLALKLSRDLHHTNHWSRQTFIPSYEIEDFE